MEEKKPRTKAVWMDGSQAVGLDGAEVHHDKQTNTLTVRSGADGGGGVEVTLGASFLEYSYQTTSGKTRPTLRVPNPHGQIFTEDWQFIDLLDSLMFVDTNCEQDTSETICVTCGMQFGIERSSDGRPLKIAEVSGFITEFRDPTENFEKIGWWLIQERIQQRLPNWSPKMKIGLVVDKDRDHLPRINAREMPYMRDYMLLPGVELYYAHTDSKHDSVFNRYLAETDRRAKTVLKHIMQNPHNKWDPIWPDAPFRVTRQWPAVELHKIPNLAPPKSRSNP